MKKTIILSFIIISVSAVCQTNVVSKIPLVDTTFSVKLTGSFFIERKQFVGQQYYNQDWSKGDILLNTGEKLTDILLKYNGLYDELIWLNTFNYGIFKLDKPAIKEFWLKTGNGSAHHFKQLKIYTTLDSIQNTFAELLIDNKEITDLEKSLKAQNVEIGANEIVRTTAVAQKAMEELNQAMIETEIKKETKDAIIESTIKNVTNLEVQTALGIAKIKETNKNIETIGEQLEALKKDVITRRITAGWRTYYKRLQCSRFISLLGYHKVLLHE